MKSTIMHSLSNRKTISKYHKILIHLETHPRKRESKSKANLWVREGWFCISILMKLLYELGYCENHNLPQQSTTLYSKHSKINSTYSQYSTTESVRELFENPLSIGLIEEVKQFFVFQKFSQLFHGNEIVKELYK